MKKSKKVNTLGLIQKMTQQNKETVNVLETLKKERSPDGTNMNDKQQFESKNVSNGKEAKVVKAANGAPLESRPTGEGYPVRQFKLFLQAENFMDKKDSFVLSLSKECMEKYEKLAQGASYKLNVKTHRNDLMRKVLEDFIERKFKKLLNVIEQH